MQEADYHDDPSDDETEDGGSLHSEEEDEEEEVVAVEEEEEEEAASDDSWASEEDLKDYRKGGYHPVRIGESFASGRYSVLSKLGWGHFSTVWLAWDEKGTQPVVLKLQKSAKRYSDAAKDEVELLRAVSESVDAERRYLVLLHDHFVHRGVNGAHHVMAVEVLGPTLLSLIKQSNYQGLPLAVVRRIGACVLVALEHLHERLKIIHTDLKPENVLCTLPLGQVETLVKRARHDAARIALADAAAAAGAAPAPLENSTEAAAAAAAAAAGGAGGGAPSTEGLSKSAKRRLKLKEKARLAKLGQQPVASEAAQTDEEAEAAEAADKGARADAAAGGTNAPARCASPEGVNGGVHGGVNGGAGGARSRTDPRLHSYKQPPMPLEDPLAPLLFKVADLGNSCWVERQFTDDIQTRQYACLSAPDCV